MTILALTVPFGAVPTAAIPVPSRSPGPTPREEPLSTVPPSGLPFDASLFFVLDDPLSSGSSHKNDLIHVHLQRALVINGVTVANAGAPAMIRVLGVHPAQAGDVYGTIDIAFEPLTIVDGRQLPLRAPVGHLTVNVSAGHESTVEAEEMATDIFLPAALLYQVFRKGRNVTLGKGAVVRAHAQAAVTVGKDGAIAINVPAPIMLPADQPAADFTVLPMAKDHGYQPTKRGRGRQPSGQTPYPIASETPEPTSPPTQTPYAEPTDTPTSPPTQTPWAGSTSRP